MYFLFQTRQSIVNTWFHSEGIVFKIIFLEVPLFSTMETDCMRQGLNVVFVDVKRNVLKNERRGQSIGSTREGAALANRSFE